MKKPVKKKFTGKNRRKIRGTLDFSQAVSLWDNKRQRSAYVPVLKYEARTRSGETNIVRAAKDATDSAGTSEIVGGRNANYNGTATRRGDLLRLAKHLNEKGFRIKEGRVIRKDGNELTREDVQKLNNLTRKGGAQFAFTEYGKKKKKTKK